MRWATAGTSGVYRAKHLQNHLDFNGSPQLGVIAVFGGRGGAALNGCASAGVDGGAPRLVIDRARR